MTTGGSGDNPLPKLNSTFFQDSYQSSRKQAANLNSSVYMDPVYYSQTSFRDIRHQESSQVQNLNHSFASAMGNTFQAQLNAFSSTGRMTELEDNLPKRSRTIKKATVKKSKPA